MIPASAAVLVQFHIAPLGLDGNADTAANDLPLPTPVSATYPTVFGHNWLAGSQITLVFGDLSAEDLARLLALHNTSGTITAKSPMSWIRCTGTFTFVGSTLTLTLTQDITINPFEVMDPFV